MSEQGQKEENLVRSNSVDCNEFNTLAVLAWQLSAAKFVYSCDGAPREVGTGSCD